MGIVISDGAQIAREVADVAIEADNLYELVMLRQLSRNMVKLIHKNYARIVGINSGSILMGVAEIIQPTTLALLHNTSTLAIALDSMNGWWAESMKNDIQKN